MMIEQLELATVIIITIIAGVIAAMIATVTSLLIQYRLRQHEETDKLQKGYLTPLLISAWELYNKLNDVVKNRTRVLSYFNGLSSTMNNVNSLGDVLSTPTMIYLSSVLYLFARYFANVEAIKKDVGLLQLMNDKETRALQLRLRQTVAVFFSGRLHEGFSILSDNRLRYQGTILEGEQVLVGELMLKQERGLHRCISFYEFCHKITNDTDFRQSLSPIVSFLGDLEELHFGKRYLSFTKNNKYIGKLYSNGDILEFIKIDQTGKIYLPKIIRDKIDTKSKYLIITLPDGDVILHKITRSKNPLRDFQRSWSTINDISQVRKEILAEAIKLAGERGD